AQLPGEEALADVILAFGSCLLSCHRVEADQCSMGWLMVRLAAKPKACCLNNLVVSLLLLVVGRKQWQAADICCPQPLPLEELPLIESQAVRQGKARQEVVTVEFHAIFQSRDTRCERGVWPMLMSGAVMDGVGELLGVQPERDIGTQSHEVRRDLQQAFS